MNTQVISGGDRGNIFSTLNVFASPSTSNANNKLEDENGITDVEGKVKTRLMSMWNNVKFGMKLKTNFSKESPVWLLGRCYHRKIENPETTELGTDVAAFTSQGNLATNDDEGFEGFKNDFISRIWMTYRREFPILNGSTYSSDCGWGCMLRSGQMLLAQALAYHFLGRGWRWQPDHMPTSRDAILKDITHRKIIKWFGDKQSRNSPFSIHSLVTLGESSGKKAGDWYGPGAVAHILKQAVKVAAEDNYEFDSLTVCVAQDCAVYVQDILDECSNQDGKWKALILLIPVRLGTEKFNPIYAPALTALLTLDQCIGIIGGRPKHSLYFIGYQDDKLIHLDPHYCQEMVDVWANDFSLNSFHCRSPRKLHLSKMDPSCCLGFYCGTKKDFYTLIDNVQTTINVSTRTGNGPEYPMFVFCDGYSRDSRLSPQHLLPPDWEYSLEGGDLEYAETEEFEVL
ncbi:PREDICTED: cysteine protease ATG4C [Nicrophorus vespilloides]|uniref:Cysteine protease n=1 Tax=Nicrophorus vespilloides TaxID=110193 RepID=A0ABM1MNW7_NICVS|nr:PREDICTED: cysteine protease ATG4C [Nicrophorus vespilloides]